MFPLGKVAVQLFLCPLGSIRNLLSDVLSLHLIPGWPHQMLWLSVSPSDEMQLYFSTPESSPAILSRLSDCLSNISEGKAHHHLKLNMAKTKHFQPKLVPASSPFFDFIFVLSFSFKLSTFSQLPNPVTSFITLPLSCLGESHSPAFLLWLLQVFPFWSSILTSRYLHFYSEPVVLNT